MHAASTCVRATSGHALLSAAARAYHMHVHRHAHAVRTCRVTICAASHQLTIETTDSPAGLDAVPCATDYLACLFIFFSRPDTLGSAPRQHYVSSPWLPGAYNTTEWNQFPTWLRASYWALMTLCVGLCPPAHPARPAPKGLWHRRACARRVHDSACTRPRYMPVAPRCPTCVDVVRRIGPPSAM